MLDQTKLQKYVDTISVLTNTFNRFQDDVLQIDCTNGELSGPLYALIQLVMANGYAIKIHMAIGTVRPDNQPFASVYARSEVVKWMRAAGMLVIGFKQNVIAVFDEEIPVDLRNFMIEIVEQLGWSLGYKN